MIKYDETGDAIRYCPHCKAEGFSIISGCNCRPDYDDDGCMEPDDDDDGMYGWEPDEDDDYIKL